MPYSLLPMMTCEQNHMSCIDSYVKNRFTVCSRLGSQVNIHKRIIFAAYAANLYRNVIHL